MTAVSRLLIPAEALHSAIKTEMYEADAEGLATRAQCGDLVGDDLAGFVRQCGGHRVQLVRDRRRVREESVDRDDCDQPGKDGQEGVEGNPCGKQRDLVGLGLLPAALGYL